MNTFKKALFLILVPAAFYTTIEKNTVNNETAMISDEDEAAPCLILDVFYNHGQQIERSNECDYCLCVDGDMFCYWQCATKQSPLNTTSVAVPSVDTTPAQITDTENFTSSILEKYTQNSTTVTTGSESPAVNGSNFTASILTNSTIKLNNKTCVVTGTEYTEGDVLPQEEGSCLQCVCGSNGRITCSPKDCVSLQQDRYRHGIESNSLDMFDVDIF